MSSSSSSSSSSERNVQVQKPQELKITDEHIDQIASQIYKDLSKHMPNVDHATKLTKFLDNRLTEVESQIQSSQIEYVTSNQFQKQIQAVNKIQQEVDFFKSTFTQDKATALDKCIQSVAQVQFEFKSVKFLIDNKALQDDLEKCLQKFKDYATQTQLIDLVHQQSEFAKEEKVTQLEKNIKKIRSDADELLSFRNEIQQFKQKTNQDLMNRPSQLYFDKQIKELKELIEQNDAKFEDFEKVQNNTNDNYDKNIHQIFEEIQNCKKELNLRLTHKDKADFKQAIKECALYEDLKDLYNKTMPEIQKFENKIKFFDIENQKFQEIVARFDQVLAEKANRQVVLEKFMECDQKYASLEVQEEFIKKMEQNLEDQDQTTKQQVKLMEHMAQMLQNKITLEIKKAKNELKPSAFNEIANGGEGQTTGGISPQVEHLLSQKADKNELKELFNQKSCKSDTEMSLRWVEIVHRQLQQVIVLISEKFRLSIENQNENESKNTKKIRKINLLNQALIICKWVQESQTPHIRDAFEIETKDKNIDIPTQLQLWEAQLNTDIKKIEKFQLSPTNKLLNDQIIQKFKKIYKKRDLSQLKNNQTIDQISQPFKPAKFLSSDSNQNSVNSKLKDLLNIQNNQTVQSINFDKEFLKQAPKVSDRNSKPFKSVNRYSERSQSINNNAMPSLTPKSQLIVNKGYQNDYFGQQFFVDSSIYTQDNTSKISPTNLQISDSVVSRNRGIFGVHNLNDIVHIGRNNQNGKINQFQKMNFDKMRKTAQNFQQTSGKDSFMNDKRGNITNFSNQSSGKNDFV